MRLTRLLSFLAVTQAFAAQPLPAGTDLSIHVQLYALDAAAAAAAPIAPADHAAVQLIPAPATLRWGESRLVLDGANAAWAPAEPLPNGIRLIADTVMPVGPNGHALLRCIASAQYMERLTEGTFALRRIEPDAPDAPRYVLAFQAQQHATDPVTIVCRPEFAVARRRASLEGVQMPVGKPLVDVFTDEIHFPLRLGQWLALLVRPPTPFESGALALIRIDQTQPVAAKPLRQRDRTITMEIAANHTTAGSTIAPPAPAAPVGYLLYDGGYGEYGVAIAGTRAPDGRPVLAAWQDSLAHAGYHPAGTDLAPRIVLIHQRGVTRVERNVRVANSAIGDSASEATTLREKAFVAISAYDHADLAAGFRTLLWRVHAETSDVANLDEVLPALITASTSWLGQDQERRRTAKVDLGAQRRVVDSPTNNDPAAASSLDEQRVHALIEKEQRAITRGHRFPITEEERRPRTPVPPVKS